MLLCVRHASALASTTTHEARPARTYAQLIDAESHARPRCLPESVGTVPTRRGRHTKCSGSARTRDSVQTFVEVAGQALGFKPGPPETQVRHRFTSRHIPKHGGIRSRHHHHQRSTAICLRSLGLHESASGALEQVTRPRKVEGRGRLFL